MAAQVNPAHADDSTAAALPWRATPGATLRPNQQFFPLRPGNLSMSARPLVRMSPPATQPVSMTQPAALPNAVPAPKAAMNAPLQAPPASKGAKGPMSQEQAQQILSLFSDAE